MAQTYQKILNYLTVPLTTCCCYSCYQICQLIPVKGEAVPFGFCFHFCFQENLKTASASMLPGDFHENIDEVKHYMLNFLDRIRQMQFLKQPSKFNPKIFFFLQSEKNQLIFSGDSLKKLTWKRKQEAEAEAVPLNCFHFHFHPKRPESVLPLPLLLPLPHHWKYH